jgi:hypothetical protein
MLTTLEDLAVLISQADRPNPEAFAEEFARAYADCLAAQIEQLPRDLERTQTAEASRRSPPLVRRIGN